MNRRAFLGRLAVGVAGLAAAGSVSAETVLSWVPARTQRYVALEYLRREFNDWCDVASRAAGTFVAPERMEVGGRLFAAAESEMPTIARFVAGSSSSHQGAFFFKGTLVIRAGEGWAVKFYAEAA